MAYPQIRSLLSITETGKDEAIPNASTFYEMDTGKLYMWDFENQQWLEQ